MPRSSVLVLLLLATGPAVAEGGLAVTLAARSTTLDPGEPYLFPFTLTYACGPARRIDLTVAWPSWVATAAVEDVNVAEGRCTRVDGDVAVHVRPSAAPGSPGELRLVAEDAGEVAEATLAVRVRRTDPQVEVRSFGEAVRGAHAGGELVVPVAATYTLPEEGTLQWSAQAPDGWRVHLPPARFVPAGEDVVEEGALTVAAPLDAAGPAEVLVRATVAAGGREARSEPALLRIEVTPHVADEPVDALEEERAPREATAPPRAPLWAVGLAFVAMVGGIYALEVREEKRRSR